MLKRLLEKGRSSSKMKKYDQGKYNYPLRLIVASIKSPVDWQQVAVRFRRANGIRDGGVAPIAQLPGVNYVGGRCQGVAGEAFQLGRRIQLGMLAEHCRNQRRERARRCQDRDHSLSARSSSPADANHSRSSP